MFFVCVLFFVFFFFKQNTAYEMRISDWSSDVCSSDLAAPDAHVVPDLYQIINLRPRADDGIGPGPAVDGGVGADLDAVAYDDAAELRHVDEALGVHREAEAAGAEAGAGMDLARAADLAICQRNVGAHHRAPADDPPPHGKEAGR